MYFFKCNMFEHFQAMLSKCIERTIFAQDQRFYFELWPRDLKINREHLFSKGNHCTRYGNSHAKWSKVNELSSQHLVYRPIDQQVLNNIPSVFERGHKNALFHIERTTVPFPIFSDILNNFLQVKIFIVC